MKNITVLGSTGSIGESTLDVVARLPERYNIIALTANKNVEKLVEQCKLIGPQYAVMAESQAAEKLKIALTKLGLTDIQILSGVEGLERVASLPEVDQVMAAIVGAAGLLPTLAAAKAGKRVLLANKEALVMSGQLFIDEVEKKIERLSNPKEKTLHKVLITTEGVDKALMNRSYFDQVITLSDLFDRHYW